MNNPEVYGGIEVANLLNKYSPNWYNQLTDSIRACAKHAPIPVDDDPSACEDNLKGCKLPTVVASGVDLVSQLPWLDSFYREDMLSIVRGLMGEGVSTEGVHYEVGANVVGSGMRGETHKDFAEPGANLYIQEPADLSSGFLIVTANEGARTYEDIVMGRKNIVVYPRPGSVSVVRAQRYPHVISVVNRPLLDIRAVLISPNLNSDSFWKEARLSLNFNFSDQNSRQRFNELGMQINQVSQLLLEGKIN